MASGRKTDKVSQLYAKTLYEVALATSVGAVEDTAADMRALQQGMAMVPGWDKVLRNPTVSVEQKAGLIAPAIALLSETVRKFVKLLQLKGRLAWLPGIAEAYGLLDEKRRGIRRAEVISASPLTEGQVKVLASGLEKRNPGHTYIIETSVDPDLVAGFRLIEGDRVTDTSLRRKLDTLKEAFAA
jgi:F-type H+-transporting ATPase subunit delta